jgi:membrane protease YdiL (CAAX protease family)
MKKMREIFGNRYVILGALLYLSSIALLWRNKNFERAEALTEFFLFGLAFPLLAWFATRRARPLAINVHPDGPEMLVLTVYFLAVSLYLVFGSQLIDPLLPPSWFDQARIKFFIVLIKKLFVFVLIPLALWTSFFRYKIGDFGFQRAGLRALVTNHLPIVLLVGPAILLFQFFLGGGAAPIRRGEFAARQLIIGLPLCFFWLAIEVGLVEEFCFRALLQSRLAAWFESEISGVALMALVFGLAHAPGFIFRHAGLAEAIGPNPSPADSIAYTIAVLSVGGIFFGIIWAQTKNLFALIVIHAATDLLPNFAEFVKTWKI